MKYPADEIGRRLTAFKTRGFDLSSSQTVEFVINFVDYNVGDKILLDFRTSGYDAHLDLEEVPRDVQAGGVPLVQHDLNRGVVDRVDAGDPRGQIVCHAAGDRSRKRKIGCSPSTAAGHRELPEAGDVVDDGLFLRGGAGRGKQQ